MNDIIIQFARLWGQRETWNDTPEEEELSEILKSYDSEEMLYVLSSWAEEFQNNDIEDTCDFFDTKILTL